MSFPPTATNEQKSSATSSFAWLNTIFCFCHGNYAVADDLRCEPSWSNGSRLHSFTFLGGLRQMRKRISQMHTTLIDAKILNKLLHESSIFQSFIRHPIPYGSNCLSKSFKFAPYLLVPLCRVLLEKLTGLQLVNNFTAFYATRRFITAFKSLGHPSLSWASPIQSIYPHPTSWRSVLILPTHLRLGLLGGLFPSGFSTKTL
jgi:hypothetical protein